MTVILFLKAMVAGFAIAAPVGPVGVLCMHRTLTDGRIHGMASGLGAALADTMYGVLAALGISFVSEFLLGNQTWLRLVGGGLMIGLGLRMLLLKPRPSRERGEVKARGLLGACVSTFALTLTNPITILSFAAVFIAVGITGGTDTLAGAGVLVFGVFTGASLWWLLLTTGVNLFRSAITDTYLVRLNYVSGSVITAFGGGVLISLAWVV